MPVTDFEICSIADADAGRGVRGWLRTTRRTVNRCWWDRDSILRPRIFCQNTGGCGSTYIVRLLRDNGIEKVFHEKAPDLNEIGVKHFEKPIARSRLVRLLRYTRHNVFFEANNRLFPMSQELAQAFPMAKFLHLYRDPAETIRSNMSKPNVASYVNSNLRLRGPAGGPSSVTPFETLCHHWKIANQRIHDDLKIVREETGEKSVTLSFQDLISGKLDDFEEFTGIQLTRRLRPPVNQRKTRPEGKFPPYDRWTEEQQSTLQRICGPLLETLKSQ